MSQRSKNIIVAGTSLSGVLLLILLPYGSTYHHYVVDLILLTIVITAFLNRKYLFHITFLLIITHFVSDGIAHADVPLKIYADSVIHVLLAITLNYLLLAKEYSQKRYEKLLSENDIPIANHRVIVDKNNIPIDYKFIYINDAQEKMMEKPRSQIIGKTVLEILPHTEKYWIDELGSVAQTQIPKRYENYAQSFNKWFSVSVYSPKKNEFATMVTDITELKMKQRALEYSMRYDELTGTPNRHYFEEKLEIMDVKRKYPLGIVHFDINGLKLINDSFGLEAGNKALIEIAKLLSSVKGNYDFVTRLSGDEFVMICPKTSVESIELMKSNIFKAIETLHIENIALSVAIGYEIKTSAEQNINDILKGAEDAMYKNKVIYGQSNRSNAIMSIFSTLTTKYNEEKVHSERVSNYCVLIGKSLQLDDDALGELELAGKLHDIGKISIPDEILKKPGRLNDDEWKIMKEHTVNGYQILRAADEYSDLADYAMTHHERIDGLGYPNALKGDNIALFSRIISVVDAYEAMTADRPYRKAMSSAMAIEELKRHKGSQFDEKIVDIFVQEILLDNH